MRTRLKAIAAALVISTCASLSAQAAPPAGGPLPEQKPPAAPAAAATDAKSSAAPTPVLERFRTYSGPRTPAALSELFNAPVSAGIRQQPEIVLSNGAAMVSIALSLPPQENAAPNFAFNGARLLSYVQIKKNEWLIEALPETGVMKAELIVLSNGAALEIPLTVAPPLPAEVNLSEKGFITFLGGKDSAAKPLLDLNGDGRRDYLDDYIFTANYLVGRRSALPERDGASKEPYVVQRPDQQGPPVEQFQRSIPQVAEPVRAAEQPAAGGGQGSLQLPGGGWSSGAPAAAVQPAVQPAIVVQPPAVQAPVQQPPAQAPVQQLPAQDPVQPPAQAPATVPFDMLNSSKVKALPYVDQLKIRNEQGNKNKQILNPSNQ